jgi:ABC-type cobalamin transport system permease subunit
MNIVFHFSSFTLFASIMIFLSWLYSTRIYMIRVSLNLICLAFFTNNWYFSKSEDRQQVMRLKELDY